MSVQWEGKLDDAQAITLDLNFSQPGKIRADRGMIGDEAATATGRHMMVCTSSSPSRRAKMHPMSQRRFARGCTRTTRISSR